MLTLVVDPKVAVTVLILPNIVMDAIQGLRRGGTRAVARRMALLLVFGVAGTVIGTRLLVLLPPRVATQAIGVAVLAFVALNATRFQPRVPERWAPWIGPPVGLAAGILGGLANVPGIPLVLYFYSLRMGKVEFVQSVALTFIVLKVVQLAAVAWYGLLTAPVLGASLALTVVALGAFGVGQLVQDRLEQRTFNRLVLGFLGTLGLWLLIRTTRW